MNISVLIITYNEEVNIKLCLESLFWCNDIVILDSYSNDKTLDIAKKYNVRFYQRSFDNYANQRNFGLNHIDYENDWLLMLDADEIVPEDLKNEIFKVLEGSARDTSLFYMRRKDFFWRKWIKYSSGYPTWFGRLMKIGHVVVLRSVNEEYETEGRVGFLKNHLFHYPFNKGLDYWIERHNKYSTSESLVHNDEKIELVALFSSNPVKRRKSLKKILYRMPGRPLVYFFVIYFLRKGFLDGSPGFHFCMLKTFYEYLICCKIKNKKMINK